MEILSNIKTYSNDILFPIWIDNHKSSILHFLRFPIIKKTLYPDTMLLSCFVDSYTKILFHYKTAYICMKIRSWYSSLIPFPFLLCFFLDFPVITKAVFSEHFYIIQNIFDHFFVFHYIHKMKFIPKFFW